MAEESNESKTEGLRLGTKILTSALVTIAILIGIVLVLVGFGVISLI